jgi:hypothetical protein
VWCGVVWCGVVWCGVVWCGVVWCGVVWWWCFDVIKKVLFVCMQHVRHREVALRVSGTERDSRFSFSCERLTLTS